MPPIVSIIIPIYNVEKYLKQCLESCINQTEKNIEIICVNDCSQDNSLDIINYYASIDSRIKIINQAENKGLGAARNIGVKNAKGEYIWFIDSDDYIDINSCKIIYDIAKKNDLDIIRFNGCSFEDNNNTINFIESEYYSTWKNNIIYNNKDIKSLPVDTEVSSVMYWTKRNIISNFQFREGVYYEDTDFTPILFSSVNRLMVIFFTAYYRRIAAGSITQSKITTKHIYDRFSLINAYENYININNIKRRSFIYREYLVISEIFFNEIKENIENFSYDKDLMFLFIMNSRKQKKLNIYRKINKIKKMINLFIYRLFYYF